MSESRPMSMQDMLKSKNDTIRRQKSEIAELKTRLDKLRDNTKIKVTYPFTTQSVMSYGLQIVGFGMKRQDVAKELQMKRFRSHFGVGPKAIIAILRDAKDINIENLLMTLCCLNCMKLSMLWLEGGGTARSFAGRLLKMSHQEFNA